MTAALFAELPLRALALGCVAPAVAVSMLPLAFAGPLGGAVRLPLILAISMLQLRRAWPPDWIPVVLAQAAIGLLAGCLLNLLYACVSTAGALLDQASGHSFSMEMAPIDGQSATPWQSLFSHLLTLLLLSGDGLRNLCSTLLEASAAWPTAQGAAAWDWRGLAETAFPRAVARGAAWAAPLVGVLLAVELGVGAMNRVMPQLGAFPIGLALKALALLLALHVALPTLLQLMAALASGVLTT